MREFWVLVVAGLAGCAGATDTSVAPISGTESNAAPQQYGMPMMGEPDYGGGRQGLMEMPVPAGATLSPEQP